MDAPSDAWEAMAELWTLLIDADAQGGIPSAILQQTKQDILQRPVP